MHIHVVESAVQPLPHSFEMWGRGVLYVYGFVAAAIILPRSGRYGHSNTVMVHVSLIVGIAVLWWWLSS